MTANKKIVLALAGGVLIGGAVIALVLGGMRGPADQGEQETAGVPVALARAETRLFEDTVLAEGDIESRSFAWISPRLPGVVEEIYVDEGDEVTAGETRLFATDSLKLGKALEIARKNMQVARCAREEKEAYAGQIKVDLDKAEKDHERYLNLLQQKVVSPDAYERKKADFDRLAAGHRHAMSLVALTREEQSKAGTAFAIAEKDLKDAVVMAPISGVVSRRMIEPGEMGAPGVPVMRIDDVKDLEASAHLPGCHYERVAPGATKVRIGPDGDPWGTCAVDYKSPTIDGMLRTFEVKCGMAGDGVRAVPGAPARMTVILASREALGVPREAVLQRAKGAIVFKADGNSALEVSLETGLETGGWIEVKGGGLSPGDRVVVQGQFLLNGGDAIQVRKGGE